MSITLKTILFVILALALGVLVGRFFLGGDEDTWLCTDTGWVKHGNPSKPMPNVGCETKKEEPKNEAAAYNFIDKESNVTFNFPLAWQGQYVAEAKNEAGVRLLTFNYVAQKGSQQMLFLIRVYPVGAKTATELEQEPNTKVLAENSQFIYTSSQALDMPFAAGSADFEQYGAMMGQLPAVLKTFKILNNN